MRPTRTPVALSESFPCPSRVPLQSATGRARAEPWHGLMAWRGGQRLYVKDQQGLRRNPIGAYRGRVGCDETHYAEALILGPRHA